MAGSPDGKRVGVVGATGAVGMEMIKVLHDRRFPVSELHLFASERSAGKTVKTPYGDKTIELFKVEEARKCDFIFLAVSGTFALQHGKELAKPGGPIVIDNSSAFRYDDDVPLVVPEINAHAIGLSRLIANPNCTTAIAAMALWPLHHAYGIRRLIVSTYQAASGAGAEGMEELRNGLEEYLIGKTPGHSVFAHPLPFNVIPHIDKFQENGYTKEEMKVVWETRKIFECKGMDVSCTAVRVPTLRAHAEAITLETFVDVSPAEARVIMANAPGVVLADDVGSNRYPMPLTSTGKYDVEVGRIRQSLVFGPRGLDIFVCGDQLLRGAASNAVFIAEAILQPERYPPHPEPVYKRRRLQEMAKTAGIVTTVIALLSSVASVLLRK